jgi:hypothetical protein
MGIIKFIKWVFTFPWSSISADPSEQFKTEYLIPHALLWAVIIAVCILHFVL